MEEFRRQVETGNFLTALSFGVFVGVWFAIGNAWSSWFEAFSHEIAPKLLDVEELSEFQVQSLNTMLITSTAIITIFIMFQIRRATTCVRGALHC